MNRSEEDQKIARQMFDRYRDDLLKRELSNTENYDKMVLTLSSAALGFSIAIIKDLHTSNWYGLLFLAWGILVGVIIASVAAYLISNKAIEAALNAAREYYIHENEEAYSDPKTTKWNEVNTVLNRFTGIGVSIAILLLVLFTAINFNVRDQMSNKSNSTDQSNNQSNSSSYSQESASIPRMEKVSKPKPMPSSEKPKANP